MTAIVSSVIGFLLEPVQAGRLYSHGAKYFENFANVQKANVDQFKQSHTQAVVPESVRDKIAKFIEEFGIKSEQFIITQSDSKFSIAEAQGSLTHWGFFTLCLSSEYVHELKGRHTLTNKDKFMIAHEISHILRDDPHAGNIEIAETSGRNRIVAYMITAAAFGILTPWSWWVTYPLGCVASKLVGFLTEKFIIRKHEIAADELAARKSRDIAQGALEYFSSELQSNLDLVKKSQEQASSRKGSCCRNLVADIKHLIAKVAIDAEGNERFDFDHPSLSSRKRRIQAIKP